MKSDPALVVKAILWPLALLTLLQRLVILVPNRAKTDDFTTVYDAAVRFLRHEPVYIENYDTVDPHYLYPPSGTLLMAPFGYFDPETSRYIFVGLSTVALLVALYVMIRMFGYGLNSIVAPAVLFFAVATEAVTSTLVYTNFNCFVLLALVVTMALLLERKDLWAGVPLGLALAVKPPMLAVLFLFILLNKQWKALITGIGIPFALLGLGFALSADPGNFLRRTVPYLGEARDYYNSSIQGNAQYFGLPDWLSLLLRAGVVIMAAVSVYLLWRFYSKSNELLWMATATGIMLTTLWLVGSLGQGYYSMLLFPMLMTVVYRSSVLGNWVSWVAVYGFLSYDNWLSGKWPAFGRTLAYLKCTLGWSLLIVVPFCVLVFRYFDARAENRLDEGIDRPLPPEDEPGRHEADAGAGLWHRRAAGASVEGMSEPRPKLHLSDSEWRQRLTAPEFRVLRQAGTEAPFTGEYTDTKTAGVYRCRACGEELFRSDSKFESHCGWPSFFSPLAGDKVIEREDTSLGMRRVEVLCANCGSHLGHVFEGEGYDTPTDLRYCINSISMRLEPDEA
ncbi:hypothetical protein MTP03_20920 [Tsukamurella sp. PLM1]|nr:hypothetical protein MTP03_20920 [Tsukamurella sp. PLM1]